MTLRRERAERVSASARLRDADLPTAYSSGSRLIGHLPMRVASVLTLCQMLGATLKGLYLHGPAGSYKTSVAASYAASQIRGGATGRYVFVPDLMSAIHASYKPDGDDSRAELVDQCVRPGLLVLDDLGKEKASEHGAGVIFEIIDGRYRNQAKGRWTIVTSNYDLPDLCNRFPDSTGDPIRRRLAELTVSVPMEIA